MATLAETKPIAPIADGKLQTSPQALARACLAAAAIAGAALILVVLPAEYGIDPTGAGEKLGIAGMAVESEADSEESAADSTLAEGEPAENVITTPTRATIERTTAMRSDEMTVELAPHTGLEVKAHMARGDGFVFSWTAKGGPVKVDMHGEHVNAPEGEFTSYWKERQAEHGQGEFTAPFDGTHGWYWRNKGDTPVTVTVKVNGFYKDLFRP